MDTMEEKNKGKKRKLLKFIFILLITFLVIPVIIFSVFYNSNKAFKQNINNSFSKMPGVIGEYFSNYPTEEEKDEKVDYLAKHFLKFDPDVAADKIYIIKKEDEGLYFNLIKEMNSISTKKTEDIVLKIRNMELRKDLLVSTYEEAKDEEKQEILSEISRMENQDIKLSLIEIENNFLERDFLEILSRVDKNKLSELLYYMDGDIKDYILKSFKEEKRNEIQRLIYIIDSKEKNLKDIAQLYETRPIDQVTTEIGNFESYSMEELGIIYTNLSNVKAGELLYSIGDEKFTEELFIEIARRENIIQSNDNIIENISKAIEFITEYNLKIKDLVQIYEKMAPGKVAKIVESMITNEETITSLELNDENAYNLSDNLIIIDVLSRMKNQTLSKVLDFMEAENASRVTRELAKPKQK